MKKVCVFGTYKGLGKKEKEDIIRLGRLLAGNNIVVVSGGFGGSMEDVSKGAKSAGGKTIGVTYYRDEDLSFKKPNEFIDEEIRTDNIFARINKMMKISDGFIVLQGGTGTLLELAAVLEHINKGMMPPKPIVAIGRFWQDVVDSLSGESCGGLVTFAKNADAGVKEILNRI